MTSTLIVMARHPRSVVLHPEWQSVHKALLKHQPSSRWSGAAYRSTEPMYGNRQDLLTGDGSRKHGGRWNPPGLIATVYASLTIHTAIEEALAHFRYYGLDPADALPRTLVTLDVSLHHLLDLSDARTRKLLSMSSARVRNDDW